MYITTNPKKTVLYTGMTYDLESRIIEHYRNRGNKKTFAGRYFAYCLIYFEAFGTPDQAIEREKEVKDWNRKKKEDIIKAFNPSWRFLNKDITVWPPHDNADFRY